MSLTIAALIRDPDSGRTRGIRLVVDGAKVRLELGATTGDGRATADIGTRAALLVALTEEKDDRT